MTVPANVRKLVRERARHRCERCGNPDAHQLHHRLLRSRGGKDTPANLVLLCSPGCHDWLHHEVKQAEDDGWILRSRSFPNLKPLRMGRRWVLLDDVGGSRTVEAASPR